MHEIYRSCSPFRFFSLQCDILTFFLLKYNFFGAHAPSFAQQDHLASSYLFIYTSCLTCWPHSVSQMLRFLLHHLAVASEVIKAFANITQLIHQSGKLFRIHRGIQIQVEHELKVPVRQRPALQLYQIYIQRIKS